MENLHFLSKISNLLISEIDTKELADGIKQLLQQIVPVKRLQIFVFDNVTNTCLLYTSPSPRDCS